MHTLLLNASGLPISELPLSVIHWHKAVRLIFLDKVKVIKSYDDWIIRSQHLSMNVPSIIICNENRTYKHTVKYGRLNLYIRDNFTCQLQITQACIDREGKTDKENLTIDHVIPKADGGPTNWINTCASCKDCNYKKGNNSSILPIHTPVRPNYYLLLSRRKELPVVIRDPEWANYINWSKENVIYQPLKRKN